MAGQLAQTDRRENGREREQYRNEGGDEGAECEQQDQEGQRQRKLLGVLEVLVGRGVELETRTRISELRDGEAPRGSLQRGDGREDRAHPVFGGRCRALEIELDERRMPVP